MKLKTINYVYDPARVVIYLRYYAGRNKVIFNDRIYTNKHCTPARVDNKHYTFVGFSLKVYKNMNLDFILSPEEFGGFWHEVVLPIV